MSFYFITGIAGSGKSTVCQELKNRGYEAYDVDDDGFARWQNIKTGYIYPKSTVKKEDRTEEFIKAHAWVVPVKEIDVLIKNSNNQNVFLCGTATNEDELRKYFKNIFELVVDRNTLKHRLLTRTNNDWGKQDHELKQSLDALDRSKKSYKEREVIVIDSSKPIKEVVDNILDIIKTD